MTFVLSLSIWSGLLAVVCFHSSICSKGILHPIPRGDSHVWVGDKVNATAMSSIEMKQRIINDRIISLASCWNLKTSTEADHHSLSNLSWRGRLFSCVHNIYCILYHILFKVVWFWPSDCQLPHSMLRIFTDGPPLLPVLANEPWRAMNVSRTSCLPLRMVTKFGSVISIVWYAMLALASVRAGGWCDLTLCLMLLDGHTL